MMRRARAFIFDLDGTLIDSLEDIAGSMNSVLLRLGLEPLAVEEYPGMIGEGVRELALRVKERTGLAGETPERGVAMYLEEYRQRCGHPSRLFPGIREMLDRLLSRGLPLGVISNKTDPIARQVVALTFPDNPFSWVKGETSEFPRKPNPSSALAFARQAGVSPGELFFVGDSEVDMQTAMNAGMVPVAVSWGFRSVKDLEAGGARIILSQPLELLDWT